MNTMKLEAKKKRISSKIPRNFRLDPEINDELIKRSELTSIAQTKIVENALREHFSTGMKRRLKKVLHQFGGFDDGTTLRVLSPIGEF